MDRDENGFIDGWMEGWTDLRTIEKRDKRPIYGLQ